MAMSSDGCVLQQPASMVVTLAVFSET